MALVYSAIPYKTPWSILSGLHAFILLAGVGAVELVGSFRSAPAKAGAIALVLIGTAHLGRQAFEASYCHYTDTTNPYVYAQSLQDLVEIADKVKEIAAAHPDGNRMYVEVICPEDDYWPLPWYLRQLSRVAYTSHVVFESDPADVVIAMPAVEDDLRKKWYEETQAGKPELYVRLFPETMYLRPRVELRGYVKSSVYERWQQVQTTAAGEQGQ
jgi:predicted membrane-bound mannosyltransferase